MKRLKFAIVGCGQIAQRHAEHIASRGELVAVCDIDRLKADALAAKYGAKSYYHFQELLQEKSLDALAICTPNALHAPQSIAALNAGFHVVCEKPMAISVVDCKQMIGAAEKSGKHIFVVKQNRYNPPVAALKKLVDDGKLGRLYSLHVNCFWNRGCEYYEASAWRGTKQLDGGILFTQFSHFIDLLYWLAGEVKSVKSLAANYAHQRVIEFEDTGVVMMEFASGALGSLNFTINSHQRNMEGSLTIFAEKGTIKIGGKYLNTLEYQSIDNYVISGLEPGNLENDYGFYTGSMSNHGLVYDNVIDVLQRGGAVMTSATDGMKTVEIIERIYQETVRL